MTRSRLIVNLTTLTLSGMLAAPLAAQLEQDNNYEGGGVDPADFDAQDNWTEGGPDTWAEDAGIFDLDSTGISFDLDEAPFGVTLGGAGYDNISRLDLLSRTELTLTGDGLNYLNFIDGAVIVTGDGALTITSLELQLGGGITFNYGNGDADDPAAAFENVTVGGQNDLAFNLIIEGEINDGSVAGDAATGGGFGDEQIVFAGDGNALLTGGIRGGGTGEDGDLDATEWELVMNQAASLILAGGAEYWLGGGVRMNYGGGSETTRGEGRGILQVTNAAVLDTTEDGQGGASSGGIQLDGWSALLIGSIDLNEDLENLMFNIGDDSTIGDLTGAGTVNTNDISLDGDSVIVVGSDGTLNGDVMSLNGNSTMLVQGNTTGDPSGFNITLDDLDISSGSSLINYGDIQLTDTDESLENAGSILNGGTIDLKGGFLNTGTLDVVFGGTLNIADNSGFGGETTVDAGVINANGNFNLNGSMTIENGGTVNAGGAYDAADLKAVELFGNLTVTDSTFASTGNTEVTSRVYLDNGTFRVGAAGEDEMSFILGNTGRLGGYGSLEINNTSGLQMTGGTLFVGRLDEDGQYMEGRNNLSVEGDIDATGSTLEFAVSVDENNNATNSQLDLDGTIQFDSGSSLSLVIAGENYIDSGTVFELIINGTILDWDELSIEEIEAANSVTRFFERGAAGEVVLNADYLRNAGTFQGNASWLGANASALGSMATEFDQIGTTTGYQFALQQLQPTGLTAGQQVVTDTRQFNVLREAVRGVNIQQMQRRPGPAQRPLGQESYSLLAGQDEADAVRSRYGYGAGPESGARRAESGSEMVAFVQGYGRSVDLSNRNGVLGVSANNWGVVAGAAMQLSQESMFGLLVGYDSFDGTLNDGGGNVDVETVRFGPFYSWSDGRWIVDAAITGGYNQWTGTHNTGLGAGGSYNWDTDGYQIDASAGLGYSIPVGGGVSLIPEGSLVYSYLHSSGYSSTSTTGQLYDISSSSLSALIPRLGMTAQFNFISGLILEGSLGWQGNYTFGGAVDTTIDNIAGLPTTNDGVDRNNIYYGAQVTWMPDWNYGFTLQYEGQSGDGTDEQSIIGSFSFEF